MGKKRKAGRSDGTSSRTRPNEDERPNAVRYDQDESFADSQDEFFAGKDQILLEERPTKKRRKRIEEEGERAAIVCRASLTQV